MGVHDIDDDVHRVPWIELLVRGGKLDLAQPVLAVNGFRGDELPLQRILRSFGYDDVGPTGQLHQLEGVFRSQIDDDVAGDDGDGFDPELGRLGGEQYRHGIVDSGIDVEDDAPRALDGGVGARGDGSGLLLSPAVRGEHGERRGEGK